MVSPKQFPKPFKRSAEGVQRATVKPSGINNRYKKLQTLVDRCSLKQFPKLFKRMHPKGSKGRRSSPLEHKPAKERKSLFLLKEVKAHLMSICKLVCSFCKMTLHKQIHFVIICLLNEEFFE